MRLQVSRSATTTLDDANALSEAKSYLRIEGDYADQEISNLMNRAVDEFENRTRRQIVTATLVHRLDCFPVSLYMDLPRAPLQSVTSVTYTDSADTPGTSWASSNYDVITDLEPGRIRLGYGKSYPYARDIVITYVAGYGTTWDSLPGAVQDCLLHMVAHKYYQRGDEREAGNIQDCINALSIGDEFFW